MLAEDVDAYQFTAVIKDELAQTLLGAIHHSPADTTIAVTIYLYLGAEFTACLIFSHPRVTQFRIGEDYPYYISIIYAFFKGQYCILSGDNPLILGHGGELIRANDSTTGIDVAGGGLQTPRGYYPPGLVVDTGLLQAELFQVKLAASGYQDAFRL